MIGVGELERVLLEEARHLGVQIGPRELALFRQYYELLASSGARVRLTATVGEREIAARHLADSLAGLLVLEGERLRLVDVGAGAGLPGLVLKIMRPAWDVVLLEANRKKCAFLRDAVAALGLAGTEVIWERAENLGRVAGHRESYAAAVGRAVAELRVLLEYGLPLVQEGGLFVGYKGARVWEEVEAARHALEVLGGQIEDVVGYRLGCGGEGALVVVRKVRSTPEAYPRRAGVPARRPL